MAYQYEAGFIGAGNIGGALARAAVKADALAFLQQLDGIGALEGAIE